MFSASRWHRKVSQKIFGEVFRKVPQKVFREVFREGFSWGFSERFLEGSAEGFSRDFSADLYPWLYTTLRIRFFVCATVPDLNVTFIFFCFFGTGGPPLHGRPKHCAWTKRWIMIIMMMMMMAIVMMITLTLAKEFIRIVFEKHFSKNMFSKIFCQKTEHFFRAKFQL